MGIRDAGPRDAPHLLDARGSDLRAAPQAADLFVTFYVPRKRDDVVVVLEPGVGHALQQLGVRAVIDHARIGPAMDHLAALQTGDADARALHAAFGERVGHRRAPRAVYRPRRGNPVVARQIADHD